MTTIDIPFDRADVNNVEMYHYVVPETDDIPEPYTMFLEREVRDKKFIEFGDEMPCRSEKVFENQRT